MSTKKKLNETTIASNLVGQELVNDPSHFIFSGISRYFSLLAGDRTYAEIYQSSAGDKSFTIRQTESYFTGHLILPL